MPTTPLALSMVQDALKTYYLPGVSYQLNEAASPFLAKVENSSENVVGKEIVLAMRYGRQGGIGNRADDGDLPTPNSRKTKQAKWDTKNIFARFQITDKTIKASKTSAGAFSNLLEQEVSDCETDAKYDLSRQSMNDGTGKLATLTAVNGLNLTVDSTRYLCEGMLIDIYTADTLDTSKAEITSVNDATGVITVSSATGAAVGDELYVNGNKGLELTGLSAVFNATTLYGIDRATYPWLNAQKIAVDGEIAEVIIQKAIDDAERKAGSKINFLMCSDGVRRAYQNLLTAQKQIVNSIELKGGFQALDYCGLPMAKELFMPAGQIACLDMNDWGFYEMADWEWMGDDGAMLSRVPGKAAYEATLLKYGDIACSRPRGQALLTGITEH